LEPRQKPAKKLDLANMSIEALNEYIGELEAEMTRARETISEKEAARSGAEAVFKS
jgi:uncharacterized small protein (DUF1192 family)